MPAIVEVLLATVFGLAIIIMIGLVIVHLIGRIH